MIIDQQELVNLAGRSRQFEGSVTSVAPALLLQASVNTTWTKELSGCH